MDLPTGMNYVLATCKIHGKCQHADAFGVAICVPCLVQKAINTGDVLLKEVANGG